MHNITCNQALDVASRGTMTPGLKVERGPQFGGGGYGGPFHIGRYHCFLITRGSDFIVARCHRASLSFNFSSHRSLKDYPDEGFEGRVMPIPEQPLPKHFFQKHCGRSWLASDIQTTGMSCVEATSYATDVAERIINGRGKPSCPHGWTYLDYGMYPRWFSCQATNDWSRIAIVRWHIY